MIHQCDGFSNYQSIDLVRLGFTDIVLPQSGGLYRIDDTDVQTFGDKERNQVVAIMSSGLKTNDDVIQFKGIELG